MGNGDYRSGAQVNYTFTLPGYHTVRLTVRDNDNLTHTISKTFLVL